MRSTADVLDNHLRCFAARDLHGLLADYAPDAVLFTPDGPLRGEAIRTLFASLIDEFAHPEARFAVTQRFVDGEHAYLLWQGETPARCFEYATDTFVVRHGRIDAQSFAAKVTSRAPRGNR